MTTYNKDFIVKNGLQVGANTTITGSLTASGLAYPVSDGSANQYLKTDGSGNLSWGTVNVNNITGNLSVSGDITSGGKVLFANVYSALSDLPSASTYHGMFAHVHATGKGYYAHAGNWVELANNSDLYTDAQAVSAVQSATNLTIDGGTIYVDTANDRVGIGDTSPQYMLDVGGTSGTGSIAVAGTEVIDSSAEVITARLKNSGVSAGSYTAADITVDAKGRVTSAASTPIGGSLTGSLANLKLQYGSTYSGTPVQGSFFFDSLNQKLKVYTGSTFVDAVPAGGGGGGGGGSSDANSTFRSYTYTLGSTTNSIQGVDDRTITAGDFVSGHKYTIVSVGTTDFTAIGASANTVGVVFTSTGAGSGTGTASPTLFYDTTSNSTTIVVYVNGVKQVYGSSNDFVATTGTSVAFTYNITSGSVVDVQVYELLTNAAYYLKSETYSQTQVSNGFLSLAGGTMTGRPVLNYNNPEIRFEDTDTSNNGEITLDNTSLRFESDPDNAVANSTIKFMVDGDTKAIINDSGKVGIGTTNPNAKLHIKENDSTAFSASSSTWHNIVVSNENTSAAARTAGIAFELNGYHANAGTGIAAVKNGTASDYGADLVFITRPQSAVAEERMRITSGGNVGIGANPTYTLDVTHQGGGTTDVLRVKGITGNSFIRFEDSDTTSNWSFGVDDGSGAGANALIAYDRINSQYRFVIDNNGNIGIGTVSPSNVSGYRSLHSRGSSGSLIDMGASGKESRIVADDNGLGFQVTPGTHTHQNIRWKAGQISGATDSHMILLANGNFGIGTTSPVALLDVSDSTSNEPQIRLTTATAANYLSIARDSSTGHYEFKSEETGSAISFHTDPDGTGSQNRLHIDRYGTISIGGVSPYTNSRLTIGGTDSSGYPTTIYLDNNNQNGGDGWINTTDNNWTIRNNAGNSGLAIGTGVPSSGNARIYIQNNGVITMGKNVSSYVGNSGDSGSHVHTTGPVSIGHNSDQGEWRKGGRVVKGWYAVGYRGSDSYMHLITDLWGGGSPHGQSEYIMGGFEIRGHRYATNSSVAHHFIYFHNWGGSTGSGYSMSSSGTWNANPAAYVNSSGYVTIRLPNGSYYGFIIDLHQYNWYPLRNITVTSVQTSSSTTV